MDDDTVPYGLYECDQCGACCKGTVIVEADYLDTRREPRLIADVQVGPYREPARTGRRRQDRFARLRYGQAVCRFLMPRQSLHDLHYAAKRLRRLRGRQRAVPGVHGLNWASSRCVPTSLKHQFRPCRDHRR
jgi:hypothetical protein